MSGLVKPQKYDWQDSNLALFGSDVEKNVKKESAETEQAWHGCGQEVGLKIWRVENFKIVEWPEDQYGEFHKGDTYIVLNTYKPDCKSEELEYNLHFWIGKHSTKDEYGTAAYKTVELDTYLDDKPVQYRETQNYETDLFKRCFDTILYMEGGVDSGFTHVEEKCEPTRLWEFIGTKKDGIKQIEKKLTWKSLHVNSVFILVKHQHVVQWNAPNSNHFERFAASQFSTKKKTQAPRAIYECFDESEQGVAVEIMKHDQFLAVLGEPPDEFDINTNKENKPKLKEIPCGADSVNTLLRLSESCIRCEQDEEEKEGENKEETEEGEPEEGETEEGEKEEVVKEEVDKEESEKEEGEEEEGKKEERQKEEVQKEEVQKEESEKEEGEKEVGEKEESGKEEGEKEEDVKEQGEKEEEESVDDKYDGLNCEVIAQGDEINESLLDQNDVFILDIIHFCFVWIGREASKEEKGKGQQYAHEYLKDKPHFMAPVVVINAGKETSAFRKAMGMA